MGSEANQEDNKFNPHSLITEECVKNVLAIDKGKNTKLISWKIKDFAVEGQNYVSAVTSVEVIYSTEENENITTSYVIKLNPAGSSNVAKDITSMFFEKESKFYLDLLPKLNRIMEDIQEPTLAFPDCYFSNLEIDKEQIYFENLNKKDFRLNDRKKGLDLPHATLAIKELARLHASSLILESNHQEHLGNRYQFLERSYYDFLGESIPIFENGITMAVAMLEKIGGYESSVSWVKNLKPQLPDILTTDTKSKVWNNVLLHGDCWNNNLLFRYNDDGDVVEVKLVDLQICRIGSPAIDLNYMMYVSMAGEVRKAHLKTLLSSYYNTFKRVMEAGGLEVTHTEQDLLQEFRAKNKFGAVLGASFMPFQVLDPSTMELSDTKGDVKANLGQIMNLAIDMIDSNPLFRHRFLALFNELLENGIIP